MSDGTPQPEALLDALFLGDELDAADVRALADACAGDDDVRDAFDQRAHADRAISGDADSVGQFERSFGRALFSARLDAMLAEETTEDVEDPADEQPAADIVPLHAAQPHRVRRPVAAYASAAAVLIMGAVALFNADTVRQSAPEFQARTALVDGFEPRADAPKLMAFCVERSGGEVVFTGREQAPFGVVDCPGDAELKLAVENSRAEWKWAAFFGVHENGSVMWYGPTPVAKAPVGIGTADSIQPIGESIRLAVNHEPGAVRVHALFTREPVDFDQLERWVAGNQSVLFERAMVVSPQVGATDTQLLEVKR